MSGWVLWVILGLVAACALVLVGGVWLEEHFDEREEPDD